MAYGSVSLLQYGIDVVTSAVFSLSSTEYNDIRVENFVEMSVCTHMMVTTDQYETFHE